MSPVKVFKYGGLGFLGGIVFFVGGRLLGIETDPTIMILGLVGGAYVGWVET